MSAQDSATRRNRLPVAKATTGSQTVPIQKGGVSQRNVSLNAQLNRRAMRSVSVL